jgi:uncharacterized membrane-anchored protein
MQLSHTHALCAVALLATVAPQAAAQPAPSAQSEEQKAEAEARAIEASLHPQSGTISIPAAHATLQLGKSYYFLPADEAKRVLIQGWGNAPDQVANVLGMVFPTGRTFHDQGWGAVVEYEDTGHVSDKDAASQDYDTVLQNMKDGAEQDNESAKQQGYPTSHVIGWAQAPTYDPATRTLIWARNIKFDDAEGNTLNYDIRTLGRTGVLSLNMVDTMDNLAAVRTAAKGLGSTVKFDNGSAYADFNPSTDKDAGYGLAGLVAAGAGLAVAKKVGLLGVILLFLKKGLVVLLAAAGGLWAWIKGKFRRGSDDDEGYGAPSAE